MISYVNDTHYRIGIFLYSLSNKLLFVYYQLITKEVKGKHCPDTAISS